jgi:peroxiredoxin
VTLSCLAGVIPLAAGVDLQGIHRTTVTLKAVGSTVPGRPKVVPIQNSFWALSKHTPPGVDLVKTGPNTWTCTLTEGESYIVGWISDRMYGYLSGPFVACEGLEFSFSPGTPAVFEYDFTRPPKGIKVLPVEVRLLREITTNGQRRFLSWEPAYKLKKPGIVRIRGLSAGVYEISARALGWEEGINACTPILYENRTVEIRSGATNRFAPGYPELHATPAEGDVRVFGMLYSVDKGAQANKTVYLAPWNDTGRRLDLFYPPAVTDANGVFEFPGVRPNMVVELWSGGASARLYPEWMPQGTSIHVDLVLDAKELTVDVAKPLPDLVIDWRDGAVGRLSDFRGKVVVVDVWATPCNPCKKALSEMDSLARELAKRDDIVFLALCTDPWRGAWETTIDQSGWRTLRHGWLDPRKNSYVVKKPVPYYFIIDRDGRVRAAGNSLDARGELNRLLPARRP